MIIRERDSSGPSQETWPVLQPLKSGLDRFASLPYTPKRLRGQAIVDIAAPVEITFGANSSLVIQIRHALFGQIPPVQEIDLPNPKKQHHLCEPVALVDFYCRDPLEYIGYAVLGRREVMRVGRSRRFFSDTRLRDYVIDDPDILNHHAKFNFSPNQDLVTTIVREGSLLLRRTVNEDPRPNPYRVRKPGDSIPSDVTKDLPVQIYPSISKKPTGVYYAKYVPQDDAWHILKPLPQSGMEAVIVLESGILQTRLEHATEKKTIVLVLQYNRYGQLLVAPGMHQAGVSVEVLIPTIP